MFDTGFDPATSDPTNNSVPREGCAIFLDAIHDDRADVTLRIGLPQPEFWRFEPAQLDVTLSAAAGVEQARLPNVIDPGYEAFTIWIEDPDGARRKYESPVAYCGNRTMIAIRRRYESTAATLLKAALDSGQLTASRERRAQDVLDGIA